MRYIGVTGVQSCPLPISDALALPLAAIVGVRAGRQLAREDADIGELADVRVADDLEGERRERPDRKSVAQGKSVDLGGRRIIIKNNQCTTRSFYQLSTHT